MSQLAMPFQSARVHSTLEVDLPAPVLSRSSKPAQESWEDWHASDYRAGRIIVVVMNAIFLAALVLYGSIAIAVAMGGHP